MLTIVSSFALINGLNLQLVFMAFIVDSEMIDIFAGVFYTTLALSNIIVLIGQIAIGNKLETLSIFYCCMLLVALALCRNLSTKKMRIGLAPYLVKITKAKKT